MPMVMDILGATISGLTGLHVVGQQPEPAAVPTVAHLRSAHLQVISNFPFESPPRALETILPTLCRSRRPLPHASFR